MEIASLHQFRIVCSVPKTKIVEWVALGVAQSQVSKQAIINKRIEENLTLAVGGANTMPCSTRIMA